MTNQKMPDEVGIVAFKDGTYDCYPTLANVPPSTSYTRTDIHQAAVAEIAELRGLFEGMSLALKSALKELWDDNHSHMNQEKFNEYFAEEIQALTAYQAYKDNKK